MNNLAIEIDLKKAKKMSKNGDNDGAVDIYNSILKHFPQNLRVKNALSQIMPNQKINILENVEKEIENIAFKIFNKNLINELYDFVKEKIKLYPLNTSLLNFLAISQAQKGLEYEASNTFKKILEIEPNNPDALNGLGILLNGNNSYEESLIYLTKAIKIQPKNSSILNNLGINFGARDEFDIAEKYFLKAIQIDKNFDARRNLSTLFVTQANNCNINCEYKTAADFYKKAKNYYPDNEDVFVGLMSTYYKLGQHSKAEILIEEGIAKDINNSEFYYNAANFYGFYKRDFSTAIDFAKKALKLSPDDTKILNNLAIFYKNNGDDVASINTLRDLIKTDPQNSKALSNLGTIFSKNGYQIKAAEYYIKALLIDPDDVVLHSNHLFNVSLMPGISAKDVYEEHLKFGEKYNNPKNMFTKYKKVNKKNKKIKLGFVSADFRKHAIATVLLPLLKNLNNKNFEITAYSNSHIKDEITDEYKSVSDYWIDCTLLNDYDLAKRIWNDEIDILFDMSGHSNGNRLITFTYKPAPIQISWMGYPLTTGLSAINYTIYDEFYAPKEVDFFFKEKVLRLPNHFNFETPKNIDNNKPPKTRKSDEVIFASFNHSRKLNEEVIISWGSILQKVENSKIIIGNLEPFSFNWIGNKLRELGIEENRVFLLKPVNMEEYLNFHKQVDIILDSWPYSGGTTTAYALQYGIPTITISGVTVAQNQSAGIMQNVGIKGTITKNKKEYVDKAIQLSSDIKKLQKLKIKNFEIYKKFIKNKQSSVYEDFQSLLKDLFVKHSSNTYTKV